MTTANRLREHAPTGNGARTAPATPHVIVPTAVYTLATAASGLGLARECLPREIRLGRLEARKRGGKYFLLGKWLLRWLETGAAHRRWQGGREEEA
jgi:hypothetical protein